MPPSSTTHSAGAMKMDAGERMSPAKVAASPSVR
jgi:hypothetical protein